MWTVAVVMAFSVVSAAPAGGAVSGAVTTLKSCPDLSNRQCLRAASTLTNAGAKGVRPTLGGFPQMTRPGQLLALTVFGNNSSRAATSALAKVCTDRRVETMVRSVAVHGLADRFGLRASRRQVEATLLRAIKDPEPIVRAAATRAIGNRISSDNTRLLKALRRVAADDDATVRVEAVLGLGMTGAPAIGDVLVTALRDANGRVRTAAADGLSFVRYPDSTEPLIAALRTDDASLRRVVSEALANQTGQRFGEDYPLWREWFINR